MLLARIVFIYYHILFFHVHFHPKLHIFFTTPIVCFPFPFYFMDLARIITSWSFMRPRKKRLENPDIIRLLGQSLTNDLAIIYAVASWLVICTIGCAQNINIGPLGQSLPKLAIIYAVAIWLLFASYVAQKNDFEPISGCLGEEFVNDVNLEMMPFKMPFETKKVPCFIRSTSADVICIIGRAKNDFEPRSG